MNNVSHTLANVQQIGRIKRRSRQMFEWREQVKNLLHFVPFGGLSLNEREIEIVVYIIMGADVTFPRPELRRLIDAGLLTEPKSYRKKVNGRIKASRTPLFHQEMDVLKAFIGI